MSKRQFVIFGFSWFGLVLVSFVWQLQINKANFDNLALFSAQSHFKEIVMARMWNSSHKGVYVPVTKITQPNIYLEDSLRDLQTTSGILLTKINPAYMTRQIAEMHTNENDLQFHITSLNPIRPENMADSWEASALLDFEHGAKSKFSRIKGDSINLYRYMAPLFVVKSCLNCHAKQGYKIGQIRGGISVSQHAAIFDHSASKSLKALLLVHLCVLVLGLLALTLHYRNSNNYILTIENKRKELERKNAQLMELNIHLQDTNLKRDKFFSIIAHDLKSPFNSILGFIDLLVTTNSFSESERNDILLGLSATAQKTYNLLENLLQWAMLELNRMPTHKSLLDIRDLIEENNVAMAQFANAKSIMLENYIPRGIVVFTDKNHISFVLRNITSNAIKFSNENSEIKFDITENGSEYIISIQDSGIGMTSMQAESLFKLEKTTSTPGTNNEKGTGLGLILCKEFVERQNGRIWVESEAGCGSTVYFSIPRETKKL